MFGSWAHGIKGQTLREKKVVEGIAAPLSTGSAMAIRAFSRSKIPIFAAKIVQNLVKAPIKESMGLQFLVLEVGSYKPLLGSKLYHDGRPRGPLWRGKKLIGKEALFVILGLKRIKHDEEKLRKFIKSHVLRLLKMDMIAVLTELERQEEVILAVEVLFLDFNVLFLLFLQNWVRLLNVTLGGGFEYSSPLNFGL